MHPRAYRPPQRALQGLCGFDDQVAVIGRNPPVVASEPQLIALLKTQRVMQRDGLKDSKKLVKSVVAPAENTQRPIDLGKAGQRERRHSTRIK